MREEYTSEIVISGKLTTERARFEKFRAGNFPRCGEPALKAMKTAEAHVQLKPGIIGVRVKIMPPDAYFPDKVTIAQAAPPSEETQETPPQTTQPSAPVQEQTTPPQQTAPSEEESKAPVTETNETPNAEEAKQ